jgi:hypothetical protein
MKHLIGVISCALIFSGCVNKTSVKEFCDRHSQKVQFLQERCLEKVQMCSEEELYDPGYTLPCHFARSEPCKTNCNDYWEKSVGARHAAGAFSAWYYKEYAANAAPDKEHALMKEAMNSETCTAEALNFLFKFWHCAGEKSPDEKYTHLEAPTDKNIVAQCEKGSGGIFKEEFAKCQDVFKK